MRRVARATDGVLVVLTIVWPTPFCTRLKIDDQSVTKSDRRPLAASLPLPGLESGMVAGQTGSLEVVGSVLGNVRFGSKADIGTQLRNVRFVPEADIVVLVFTRIQTRSRLRIPGGGSFKT